MSKQRTFIQAFSTLFTNAYIKGFFLGRIYTGPLKHVCVPTLNCYSCPGALYACPIGSAQVILASGGGFDITAAHTLWAKIGGILSGIPVFVIGILTLLGAFIGRASCGWLCPFGWLQELVYKIPTPLFKKYGGGPKFLKYVKYIVLLVFVILLPLFAVDSFGSGQPFFCKFICPAGTLEGGLTLPLLQPDLRAMLGPLFFWKLSLLIVLIIAMAIFRRPFCNWLCPLGACLAPFNKISFYRLEFNEQSCIHCGLCTKTCPAGLDVPKECDSADCVRCLECSKICPKSAISVENAFSSAVITDSSSYSTNNHTLKTM